MKSKIRIRLGADSVGRIALQGFLLRAVLLMLMLLMKQAVSPYFIADDIVYEKTAQSYLMFADGMIDLQYLERLVKGYMQPFWPVVMCLSAGIFRTLYMGRVINICLSTACIPVIYKTVQLLTPREKTAALAAKLFAFLPVTVITCCFPIKDIYLTWAVLYAFYVFLQLYQKKKIQTKQIVLTVLALIGTYFARGAVTEMMLVFFGMLWLDALRKQKQHKKMIAVVALALVCLYLYGANMRDAFATKIEDYGGYNERTTGMLAMLQMQNPWEFYKIPFAYFFATLQPMTLNYFAVGDNLWMRVLRMGNISIYPVAIANLLYVFRRKHNLLYWFCGVVIYCAIISMCLGIFRHYLFLIPLEMINCALLFDQKKANEKNIVILGTIVMIMFMLVYSLITSF